MLAVLLVVRSLLWPAGCARTGWHSDWQGIDTGGRAHGLRWWLLRLPLLLLLLHRWSATVPGQVGATRISPALLLKELDRGTLGPYGSGLVVVLDVPLRNGRHWTASNSGGGAPLHLEHRVE